MERNLRILVALSAIAALVLLSTPVRGESGPSVAIDEEVGIGETLLVTVTTGNRSANISISIDAPGGGAYATGGHLEENTTRTWSFLITREWDFGRATVWVLFEIGNETITKVAKVEVVCRSGCLAGLIAESITEAMKPVWYFLIPLILLALLYVGNITVAYRRENAEDSWADMIRSIVRPIRRSSIRVSLLDRGGYIPNDEMAQLKRLHEGVVTKIPAAIKAEKKFKKEVRWLLARKDAGLKELRKVRAKRTKYERGIHPIPVKKQPEDEVGL